MIRIYKTKKEIGFEILGETFQKLTNWTYQIDEKIFRKQMSTGNFREDVPLSEDTLAIMKHLEKQGEILPYYGADGSSGACIYRFKFNKSDVELEIDHTFSGETVNFSTPLKKVSRSISVKGRRFKFSPLRFLINEPLPEEWIGKPKEALVCRIFGKEYKQLVLWPNWKDSLALSERYEFSFGEVSLGTIGFVTKLRDLITNNEIDVTDYEDW